MSAGEKAGIGAGVAAAAAAAALGAYFLYGSKNAKQNRAKVKGWMLKARGEVLEQVEKMQSITEGTYEDVVQNVLANYRGARNVSAPELAALAADLRKHWRAIKPMFQAGRKGAARGTSRKTARPKRKAAPKKSR